MGDVEKSNYLAHTIREMELALMRTRCLHYNIYVYVANNCQKSKITFFDYCCEIRLTMDSNSMDDKELRLILAHELGHLIRNFDRLKNPEVLANNTPSPDAETYAWIFAYHLITEKSNYYSRTHGSGKFIYRAVDLEETLSRLVRARNPAIHSDVMRGIKE